jgi:RNA polymerase sigma-70 factor, ECF subfamily
LSVLDERKIRRGLLERDPAALEELMDAYGSHVYHLVDHILHGLGNSGDVEECCSDVFVAVWERAAAYDPERGNLKSWVLTLARYRALDYRRKLGRRAGMEGVRRLPLDFLPLEAGPGAGGDPEGSLLRKERQVRVQDALASLEPGEKEVLYRRYFLEESIEHMAADLGISRGALDNRLWRARRSLKEFLYRDEEVPADGRV